MVYCDKHSAFCRWLAGNWWCIYYTWIFVGPTCESCLAGYRRNANDNSPYECINPDTLVSIPEPTITVTIGGRAELICRPYASGKSQVYTQGVLKFVYLKVSTRAKIWMQKFNNGSILYIFIISCYKRPSYRS